ncbi:MAG TPA: prepilin-type N-terminal cleavage/methylation domain-containing protein [Opitutaceae bacterium]|nr:prepilin-type N-terminal cleavage/methylation domain-containing protein [Opitutaceae bacterium]
MITTSPVSAHKPSFAECSAGASFKPTTVPFVRPRRGFTLVEIMVVVVLSGLILGGVMSTYIAVLKSSMRLWHYEKMERDANRGLETFARDVRMAKAVAWGSDTTITLTVPRVSGGGDRSVNYAWHNGTKTFRRTEDGVVSVLVNDVQAFAFNRFNKIQNPALSPAETHQIQLTMTTIPPTNGVYAESSKRVLSARYVLRN